MFLLNDLMIQSADGAEHDFVVCKNVGINVEFCFAAYAFNLQIFHLQARIAGFCICVLSGENLKASSMRVWPFFTVM